ncbi:MAG TPA: ATP-dependent DNA helicase RecG [Paenalcaligenes sp.]|nr:ATP-dependent DNA helicase RecG [Paenalcaligenes sp.]
MSNKSPRKSTRKTTAAVKKAAKSRSSTISLEERLAKLGLHQDMDFVVHLPLRYEDETRITPIRELQPGRSVLIQGTVLGHSVQYRPRRQLLARLQDDSGLITLRWLHFYPSQINALKKGAVLRLKGEVRQGFHGLEMVHPNIRSANRPLADTLTPVYPTTAGLSQAQLNSVILDALKRADLSDTLPASIQQKYSLWPFEQAIRFLHYPSKDAPTEALLDKEHPAWYRVQFDELLAQQLALAQARARRLALGGVVMPLKIGRLQKELIAQLPFELTGAQERVVKEIIQDMHQAHPMHRLVQGDVGSGKTIVAALVAAHVIDNGYQVALMAPTEILAEQHYEKIHHWLAPLGVSVEFIVGSQKASRRREIMPKIADGSTHFVIGTQALIQEQVQFHNLALVLLDEQHRFGVEQRLALSKKGLQTDSSGQSLWPHQLTLSATPIPRSLAMTYYADLDLSVIDELPPGRKPIQTKLVAEQRREQVVAGIGQEVAAGRQVYWVCPLIEESEALQLKTAEETYERLQEQLPDCKIGLLHGRVDRAAKQALMDAFRVGEVDILVATTVIEVGVDVPNACLMVIEHAERFGLAQLHQLRGRVGRGSTQSYCILLYQGPLSETARERLRAMYETTDGFEIARRDLDIRGPGEFLGMRQSGQMLLRFAQLNDQTLLNAAKDTAQWLLGNAPDIAEKHLNRWLGGREELMQS